MKPTHPSKSIITLFVLLLILIVIPASASPLTDKINQISTKSNINQVSYLLDNPQNLNLPISESSKEVLKTSDKFRIKFYDNPTVLYFVKYNGLYEKCLPAFDCNSFPTITLTTNDINFAYAHQQFLESILEDNKISWYEKIHLFILRNL